MTISHQCCPWGGGGGGGNLSLLSTLRSKSGVLCFLCLGSVFLFFNSMMV